MKVLLFNYFADNYTLLLLLVTLWVVLAPNSPVAKADSRMLLKLSIACFILSMATYVDEIYMALPYPTFGRLVSSFFGYMLRPLILIIPTMRFDRNRRNYVVMWLLYLVNTVVYATAFFSPVTYSFNSKNEFVRGPLGFTCHFISFTLMFIMLHSMMKMLKGKTREGRIIISFMGIAMIVGVAIETVSSKHCLIPTAVTCCLSYYMYLHIIYANEAMEKQKKHLRDQRDALMISQIRPHFIYNVLNIIYYLCRKNPKLAGETVVKFSDYLRQNLDSSTKPDQLIPIRSELNHTKNYADLEMLRFDNISVEYMIDDEAFDVPALTIQPMVENAIRHGVRDKEEGLIIVSTYENENSHFITIEDNGVGMVTKKPQLGEHEHIGIANVKERIEEMCGGEFSIKMVPNVGTTVKIRIPKQKPENTV